MTDRPTSARPLEGIRVVDLTRALAGPYATLLLAGLGAQVIKVEDPSGGDLARDNSPYAGPDGIDVVRGSDQHISMSHLSRAHGKYGVTLNLKHPDAAGVFRDLVASSDVVIENYTAGTADRLGVGYQMAVEANPAIVYCSLSGFGATADPGTKAMDVLVQAMSGVMYTSGEPDDPPVRLGIPVADLLAPVFGVIGILSALHRRHVTGRGDYVDVSMLGALTSFVSVENWEAMARAGMEARTGRTVQRLSPFGVFECADGYVAIVAVHQPLAQGLARAMGRPELLEDPAYADRDARVANAAQFEALIEQWSRQHPVADVLERLEAQGVPAAPVRTPTEAVADPQVVARGETLPLRHPDVGVIDGLFSPGVPILFGESTKGFDDVMPARLGQHNDLVYGTWLGYGDERVSRLRDEGVV